MINMFFPKINQIKPSILSIKNFNKLDITFLSILQGIKPMFLSNLYFVNDID